MARIELDLAHSYKRDPRQDSDYALLPLKMTFEDGGAYALLGPSGCGKTTMLNIMSGLLHPSQGSVRFDGRDVTRDSPQQRNIAQVFQFPVIYDSMTVEENLWLGGYLMDRPAEARKAAEAVFDRYPRLADRRRQPARVLSGGERRLLEISRALVMRPRLLLVDEPSIGLEPRFIDMVFEILHDLQRREGISIVLVEQNAKKGLEFADIGYVVVAGGIAMAGKAADLLGDEAVVRLFLGG